MVDPVSVNTRLVTVHIGFADAIVVPATGVPVQTGDGVTLIRKSSVSPVVKLVQALRAVLVPPPVVLLLLILINVLPTEAVAGTVKLMVAVAALVVICFHSTESKVPL